MEPACHGGEEKDDLKQEHLKMRSRKSAAPEGMVFLVACCPEAAIPSWLKPQRRWKAESKKQSRIVVGNRASWKSAVCKARMSGVRARQVGRLHCSVSGTWAGWHQSQGCHSRQKAVFTVKVWPRAQATRGGVSQEGHKTYGPPFVGTEQHWGMLTDKRREPKETWTQKTAQGSTCRGQETTVQTAVATRAAAAAAAENWQIKQMILHQNHRRWEMQGESGSPRCPLASTNELSKIGIHVPPRGKKKTKRKTHQHWDLGYPFNVSWCGRAWKNEVQCPVEWGRVDRTRT